MSTGGENERRRPSTRGGDPTVGVDTNALAFAAESPRTQTNVERPAVSDRHSVPVAGLNFHLRANARSSLS
jgi:hypothetical protein